MRLKACANKFISVVQIFHYFDFFGRKRKKTIIILSLLLLSYLLELIDTYYGGPSLIWVVFLEAVMIAFFYGVPTFINDLVEITRSEAIGRAWPLFYLVYCFVCPAALALVSPCNS